MHRRVWRRYEDHDRDDLAVLLRRPRLRPDIEAVQRVQDQRVALDGARDDSGDLAVVRLDFGICRHGVKAITTCTIGLIAPVLRTACQFTKFPAETLTVVEVSTKAVLVPLLGGVKVCCVMPPMRRLKSTLPSHVTFCATKMKYLKVP